MHHQEIEQSPLDYFPCQYGASKQVFRGPKRCLDGDFAAFIGGIETYGKFIDMPFPALVECETGLRSVNLGCTNAGIDAFFNDKSLLEICCRARVTVVEVLGAQNMSNRFYSVHPRRNDRFLRASRMLEKTYPEVDFTDFSFTRHLLTTLAEISSDKFELLVDELREAWLARMKMMLSQIDGQVILLWLADQAPPDGVAGNPYGSDPMFVDRSMVDALSGHVSRTVEIVGAEDERSRGMGEMFFRDSEQLAAAEMLGPVVHRRTTSALAPIIKALM